MSHLQPGLLNDKFWLLASGVIFLFSAALSVWTGIFFYEFTRRCILIKWNCWTTGRKARIYKLLPLFWTSCWTHWMSLQIQNGEHVRSHFTAPIRTQAYWTPHVGTPRCDWPPLLNSFGEPNWSVHDPLAAVGSSCQCTVCVWYSERRRNWLYPTAS